ETVAALRARFGLDQPVLVQLIAYLDNLAHFSLGYSPRYNLPVADIIGQRLPGTVVLMATALVIALAGGIALGIVMATFAGRWPYGCGQGAVAARNHGASRAAQRAAARHHRGRHAFWRPARRRRGGRDSL